MPRPTARRTRRIWLAVFDVVELGKDLFLAVVLVFRLSNFCHDTFQLDIELVDNRLSLSTMASDVDGFRGKVAARAFILFLSVSMRRGACGTRPSPQGNRVPSHGDLQ